jgi:hypothetical protein
MTTINISLTEKQLKMLKEKAKGYGLTAEELVSMEIEGMIKRPDEEFINAASYVLKKNKELYQRLAK